MIQFYKSLVRLHLEYVHNHLYIIESVQRSATRFVPSLRNKSFEMRLSDTKHFSSNYRRLRDGPHRSFQDFQQVRRYRTRAVVDV